MSGGERAPMEQVWLRCAACGHEQPIWRRKDRLKERGHVKHMYCPTCRDTRPHKEVRK